MTDGTPTGKYQKRQESGGGRVAVSRPPSFCAHLEITLTQLILSIKYIFILRSGFVRQRVQARWAIVRTVATADRLAEAKQRLRALGLKVTPPRVAVLQVLELADRPLSHAEIVARLAPQLPGADEPLWDRATVYRNLVALAGVGLVRITSHAGGIGRYELARQRGEHTHPHFVCDDCGIVSCLPEAQVVTKRNTRWNESLRTAEVQFVGRCPSCSSA